MVLDKCSWYETRTWHIPWRQGKVIVPELSQYCRIYRNMVENNLGTKNQCLVVGVYAEFAAVVVFAVVVEVVVEIVVKVVVVVVVKELVFSSRYHSILVNMTYF